MQVSLGKRLFLIQCEYLDDSREVFQKRITKQLFKYPQKVKKTILLKGKLNAQQRGKKEPC